MEFNLKKNTLNKIIIPYGRDLSNIGTGLTIEDIKTINPLLGIDEYNTSLPSYVKNEKFFQYYRDLGSTGSLNGLGVMVQIYNDTYRGTLFNINKANNTITLGIEYLKPNVHEIDFQSFIDLRGRVRIYNLKGLELMSNVSDILTMNLVNRKNDVSFIETNNTSPINTVDIILDKGL
jgi:hypothetical protein